MAAERKPQLRFHRARRFDFLKFCLVRRVVRPDLRVKRLERRTFQADRQADRLERRVVQAEAKTSKHEQADVQVRRRVDRIERVVDRSEAPVKQVGSLKFRALGFKKLRRAARFFKKINRGRAERCIGNASPDRWCSERIVASGFDDASGLIKCFV